MPDDGIVLGFDFGVRRIGVAIGQSVTGTARPLDIIAVDGDARWLRLQQVVDAWQPRQLVVGVPRHPDGTPHEMTTRCERFARQLAGRFRLPVACVDERYSSVEAAARREADRAEARVPGRLPTSRGAVAGGRPGEPVPLDADAAAVILQQWFDERAAAPATDSLADAPEGENR